MSHDPYRSSITDHLHLVSDDHDHRIQAEIRVRMEKDPVSRGVQGPAPEGHGTPWHWGVRAPQGAGCLFVRWVWNPTLKEQHQVLERFWLAGFLRGYPAHLISSPSTSVLNANPRYSYPWKCSPTSRRFSARGEHHRDRLCCLRWPPWPCIRGGKIPNTE